MKNVIAFLISVFAVCTASAINVPNGRVQYINNPITVGPEIFFKADDTQDECRAMFEQAFADIQTGLHKVVGIDPLNPVNRIEMKVGHQEPRGATAPDTNVIYVDRTACEGGLLSVRYVVLHEIGHQYSYWQHPDLRTDWRRHVKYSLFQYEVLANRAASYLTLFIGWDRQTFIDELKKGCDKGNEEQCDSMESWSTWIDY